MGLVTRISVRTETQTLSCLIEPTAEHRCIIQLGCKVMSVPSTGRALSLSQLRRWHGPGILSPDPHSPGCRPVPLEAAGWTDPSGSTHSPMRFSQVEVNTASALENLGERTLSISASLPSNSALALLTSKRPEWHKETPNSVVLGPCTHLEANTNLRAGSDFCRSKGLLLNDGSGMVQKIKGAGRRPQGQRGLRRSSGCMTPSTVTVLSRLWKTFIFLVARRVQKLQNLKWQCEVVAGQRWEMKIQIMKRITVSNLLIDTLPQVNTQAKARESGPQWPGCLGQTPRDVSRLVEASCSLAEGLGKGHLPSRFVDIVWPGFLWRKPCHYCQMKRERPLYFLLLSFLFIPT